MVNSQRLSYIDAISGFFIIQIIVGHIFQFVGEYEKMSIWVDVFSFFMPYFYFKSGLFSKSICVDLNSVFHKSIKNLLIPYALITCIGYLINLPFELYLSEKPIYDIILRPFGHLLKNGSMPSSLALWFLLSLFWVKIIYAWICKNKYSLYTALVICLLGGAFLCRFKIYLPISLSTIFPGLLFFISGFFYNYYKLNDNKIVLLLSAFLYFFCLLCIDTTVEMRRNSMQEGLYFAWYIKSLAGIFLMIKFFSLFHSFSFLSYIGKNSMGYYVLHWLILYLYRNILDVFYPTYNKTYFIISAIVICATILPIINNLIKSKCPKILGISR